MTENAKKTHRSKNLTHNQREEEIEIGCEEEREGSLVPIFPTKWDFVLKSQLCGRKRGCLCYELKGDFYSSLWVSLMTGF